MDSLWRTTEFSPTDLALFKEGKPAPCTGIRVTSHRLQDDGWLDRDDHLQDLEEWETWFKDPAFNPHAPQNSTAVILFPRAVGRTKRMTEQLPDHPAILQRLPVTKDAFQEIITKLHVHRAFAILVNHGLPSFSRIPCSFAGDECIVYTLRVEHTMPHHSALSVSYFPSLQGGKKTYAMFLGCTPDDRALITSKLGDSRQSIFSPFTLIKIFLELERRRRFLEVDEKVTLFQNTVQNYGHLPLDSDDAEGSSYITNAQDPKNLIGLYLRVCHLKNGLVAWKAQLLRLADLADEFKAMVVSNTEIDPKDYLERLVDEYDMKINKCDLVLQGTSLTFQMETAHLARMDAGLSRIDTKIALRDGKQMKAIALLTMFFLPATFVATIMAVPVFDFENVESVSKWSLYLIIFLPLNTLVLGGYFLWVYIYGERHVRDTLRKIF